MTTASSAYRRHKYANPQFKAMDKEFFIDKIGEWFGWLMILVAPASLAMKVLLVLIICDFVTGIYASYHLHGAVSIQSRRMSSSISKILMYYMAIIAGLATEQAVPGIPFNKIAVGFVAMIELKSIYENVAVVTGVDIWTQIRQFMERRNHIPNKNKDKTPGETKKEGNEK
jgi:phage-related holin